MPKHLICFIICLYHGLSLAAQTPAVDYSMLENWAVLPTDTMDHWVQGMSSEVNHEIDVFYVYPTILTSSKDKRWNYPIKDEVHRKQVLETIVRYQASAFANAGNFYMPFYRQAHLKAYYHLEKGGREALYLAYDDIKASFQYYLDHYNHGKGIILAGHSQGSTMLSLLLKEFFDGKPLQNQLVAAYLPGIGIAKDEFKSIELMTSSNQIGGFVSWNTLKRKYETENYCEWYEGKSCVNPISWDTSYYSPKNDQKGFLYSNGKKYSKSFETHLVDGAIWISVPKFPFRFRALLMRNYHPGDINLFWEDIRVNAILRGKKYIQLQE
jgi:hypothetical protein